MLEFLDSFDGYASDEINLRWTKVFNCTIIPGGRNGKGLLISGGHCSKTTHYNANWVCGFAYNDGVFDVASGAIYQATTPGANGSVISLVVELDGTLSLHDGTSAVMGNTGDAFSIKNSTWYYIELKYQLIGTNRVTITNAYLRVNGQTLLGPLGGDANLDMTHTLFPMASAQINEHALGMGGTGAVTFDDFYLFNQDGTVNNDFAGDVKLGLIRPNVDIATPFLQSAPSSAFTLINEAPPDFDVTYIYSNTPEQFENFFWEHLPPFLGEVICVQYSAFARKDDEGSRAFQLTLGSGPSVKSSPFYIGDSYLYYIFPLDTDNGAPWTVANFNAESFGIFVFTIPIPS